MTLTAEQIKQRVLAAIAEALDVELDRLTPEARLDEDLNFDGVDLLFVASAVEDVLGGRAIPDADWLRCITVGDVIELAQTRLEAR